MGVLAFLLPVSLVTFTVPNKLDHRTRQGQHTPAKIREELSSARSTFNLEQSAPLPIGAGYIGWQLEEHISPEEMLVAALDYRPKAIWFSFGNDLLRWIRFVREYDETRDPGSGGSTFKTLIFVQVGSVEEALVAVNEWEADVLIAQG